LRCIYIFKKVILPNEELSFYANKFKFYKFDYRITGHLGGLASTLKLLIFFISHFFTSIYG